MAKHSSATREEKPHVLETSRTNTIINALKRRAQAVLNDESLDPRSRAIIRKGLETYDPWLAEFVRRADAGERVVDKCDVSQTPATNKADSTSAKIEALAEIICGCGDECAGALLVLMATLQNSTDAKALANTAKHFAFTRCGELNLNGMVDAQIARLESELLAGKRVQC